jgi:hypothetical protein
MLMVASPIGSAPLTIEVVDAYRELVSWAA